MSRDQCIEEAAHALAGCYRRLDERATQKPPASRGPMRDEANWQKDLAS